MELWKIRIVRILPYLPLVLAVALPLAAGWGSCNMGFACKD
jgi:hypothetical protein